MKPALVTSFSICLELASFAQTGGLASGTALTVDAGTTLRLEGTQTCSIAAGASLENNGTIVFGPQAALVEADGSPIFGDGVETTQRTYTSALAAIDPAGLGLRINTALPTGLTSVTRGHLAFVDNGGLVSLLRWYDVDAATNTGLDASIAFGYDAVELNGIPETDLLLHVKGAGNFWNYLPSSTVDLGNDEVLASALDSLGTFTCFADISTIVPEGPEATAFLLVPTISSEEVVVVAAMKVPQRVELFAPDGRLLRRVMPDGARTRIAVSDLAAGRYVLLIDGSTALSLVKP